MDDSLTEKFPDLQPGCKPSLNRVNGCGNALYGKRDHDDETGTYVTTEWFCLLLIPLFALRAYRVSDAEYGGWYCLGRVPLSKACKTWNRFFSAVVLMAIGAGIGLVSWNYYTTRPGYVATQKLKQVDLAVADGKGGQAARLCREVMDLQTPKAEEAKQKLAGFIQNPPGPASEATEVFKIAVALQRENRCPVADLFGSGKVIAEKYAEKEPNEALNLLEVIATFAPNPEAPLAFQRELLEKMYARDPNNIDTASRLASVCEAKGDFKRCEQVLSPFEKQLGDKVGAAILGRIYSARGDYDRAYALLKPYVDSHLPAFRNAQENFAGQTKLSQDRIMKSLKEGNAPGFDYERHKRLTKDKQEQMVDDFLSDHLKRDPYLAEARQKLMAERGVVSAVLDFGLLQSQRAQKIPVPAERKAELEAAEKTFLSISQYAGESDEYRLSLGQVYYWLGRPKDGKKMFDELLASRNKSTTAVIEVARRLREIGDFSEARQITEQAYTNEKDQSLKQSAARFRALLHTDLNDDILWLSRCNPNDPSVEASLADARGQKAHLDGKDEEAEKQYRKAIEIYDKMPESYSTLNNSALLFFALHNVTHDRSHFTTGVDRIDRAIALQASNSILLLNASGTVLEGAARDVVGSEVDSKVLKREAGFETLSYLYLAPADRTAVVTRFMEHPGTVKARGYAEKLMTLSPKKSDSYTLLHDLYERTRNIEGLKAVLGRLEKTELDLGDARREYKEYVSGESDARRLGELRKAVDRATEGLKAARTRKDKTFAVAVGNYVRLKQGGWLFGEKADADELVKLAEEAFAVSPSEGSESVLYSALLFRAHLTSIAEDPAYAKLAEKNKRVLGTNLLRYLIGDKSFQSKLAANPDVKRFAAMTIEEFHRDPEGVMAAQWSIVQAVSPRDAAEIAKAIQGNERLKLRAKIEHILIPGSSSQKLEDYWTLRIDGKEAEAKKLFPDLGPAQGAPAK
jgi:tetratricopeptide (TPR) repeat protein